MSSQARILIGVVLLISPVVVSAGEGREGLPRSVRGGAWFWEDSMRTYAGEALFRLIDGGAPLYFEYGFVTARAARYRCARGGVVAVEAYEMKTRAGAYGLFSYLASGSGRPIPIAEQAVEGTGFILAWSGHHVWSITDVDSVDADSVAVLAREVAGQAVRGAGIPPLVSWVRRVFPGLQDVVLFHGPLGFQKLCPIVPDRSMRIGSGVSGVMPEATVVALIYETVRDADGMIGALVSEHGRAPVAQGGHPGPQYFAHDGGESLVGRRGTAVWIIAGKDRGQLRLLWKRLEAAERSPGR